MVERILGKDEVTGSIPVNSSTSRNKRSLFRFFCFKSSTRFICSPFLFLKLSECRGTPSPTGASVKWVQIVGFGVYDEPRCVQNGRHVGNRRALRCTIGVGANPISLSQTLRFWQLPQGEPYCALTKLRVSLWKRTQKKNADCSAFFLIVWVKAYSLIL